MSNGERDEIQIGTSRLFNLSSAVVPASTANTFTQCPLRSLMSTSREGSKSEAGVRWSVVRRPALLYTSNRRRRRRLRYGTHVPVIRIARRRPIGAIGKVHPKGRPRRDRRGLEPVVEAPRLRQPVPPVQRLDGSMVGIRHVRGYRVALERPAQRCSSHALDPPRHIVAGLHRPPRRIRLRLQPPAALYEYPKE